MSATDVFNYAITVVETIVIAFGLAGHLVSILIFSRKTFRNNSISTYCIALAIVECLAVVQLIANISNLAFAVNLIDQSESLCKFFTFIPTILSAIQPTLLVAFSVDKLLSMKTNPIALLKKKWFQWSVVAVSALFNTLLFLVMPIFIKRRELFPGYYLCDFSTISFFNMFMAVNMLETCLIPFVVMTIASIVTIRMLKKSRVSVERITGGQFSKDRRSRDRKYAISSLTFNTMFIIFKLPLLIYFYLYSFYAYFDIYFFKISFALFFVYTSMSFFIHVATNSLFRREFMVLFRLMKRNAESVTQTMSQTNHRVNINLNPVSATYDQEN